MGAPKKIRKKYIKPKDMWSVQRIGADRALIREYGLRNMRELWRVQTELSRIRKNVRELLAGSPRLEQLKGDLVNRLARLGITNQSATLDSLLDLKANAFLERRLQSIVFRKGMARSMKQARQLITHGFISIEAKKVTRPGYLVNASQENAISYYKHIDIQPREQQQAAAQPSAAASTS